MIERLTLAITYRCNCKCIMCSIHTREKVEDLTPYLLQKLLDSPRMSTLKEINITGGEPTLHPQLTQLVQIIIDKSPQLQRILLSTNGLNYSTILYETQRILHILPPHIRLIVCVSLDSVLDDTITNRGIANASIMQKECIRQLMLLTKQHPFEVIISFTITKINYMEINAAYNFAASIGAQIEYVYATINTAFISSASMENQFCLSPAEIKETINSLQKIVNLPWIAPDRRYYDLLFQKLDGAKFKAPCLGRSRKSILVEPDGKTSLCGMTERALLGNIYTDTLDNILVHTLTDLDPICEGCITNSFKYSDNAKSLEINILNYVRRIKSQHKGG